MRDLYRKFFPEPVNLVNAAPEENPGAFPLNKALSLQDKRIELLITGLLPLNRRKNAVAWKAQGIGAEFHGISRRGSPWNWSG